MAEIAVDKCNFGNVAKGEIERERERERERGQATRV
jgi:hypothetical protein